MNHVSLALLPVLLTACQTLPGAGAAEPEAGQAAQAWAAAFNACDGAKAAALYDVDAVLWGTVSPALIASPAGVRQYFERVCSANPQPKVAWGEQRLRVYADTAINSGTYTFTIFPAGQARQVPARYSFTYRKREGRWLIVDHHSSALPAAPASAAAPARQ